MSSNVAVSADHELRQAEPVFLRFPELKLHGVPYSRQHVDTMERLGRFPKRIKLSPGVVVWRTAEIQAWVADRTGGRE